MTNACIEKRKRWLRILDRVLIITGLPLLIVLCMWAIENQFHPFTLAP